MKIMMHSPHIIITTFKSFIKLNRISSRIFNADDRYTKEVNTWRYKYEENKKEI